MKSLNYISAEEAVKCVKSYDHIHLSSVACVPHILLDALCKRVDAGDVDNLKFHHFHTEGYAPYADKKYEGKMFDQGFFIGANVRKSVNEGHADYIPVHLSESQRLYRERILPCNVAMVQVSLPDENGMVSLGTSVDCSVAAIEVAEKAIAVINPNVPFAYGDTVSCEKFDYYVYDESPLIEGHFGEPDETENIIGKICAELIPDGACIQMGIGSLPNAVLKQLHSHKNLGIHTEMFADGVLELVEKGIIDGSKKEIDTGKIVASFLMGSKKVYDFIDKNPVVLMKDIGYTNCPHNISKLSNMIAINSAIEVDLTGQICADSIGTRHFSGTGGQLDFVRGATHSKNGKSITAFASRTNKGAGKIVPVIKTGGGIVTPRADAHHIITEWGHVDLTGRSLQERARLLISISHPDDREMLEREAFNRFGAHFLNLKI